MNNCHHATDVDCETDQQRLESLSLAYLIVKDCTMVISTPHRYLISSVNFMKTIK